MTDNKKLFAERLQKLMAKDGLTYADLARKATLKGKKYDAELNRDHVYRYATGQTIPGPARLKALGEALGVEPDYLLPTRFKRRVAEDEITPRSSGDSVRIKIDRDLPVDVALKILTLIETVKG